MHEARMTLAQFMAEEQRRNPEQTDDLSGLMNSITTACKLIGNAVAKGPLVCRDDDVRPYLERLANESMLKSCVGSSQLAALTSDTEENIMVLPKAERRGPYLLLFDPLNGAINLDINFMSGTIFSVLRRERCGDEPTQADFLQPGAQQVCAGMVQYGASSRLLLTLGHGVHGFTLDRDVGEFILTHPSIRIPQETSTFAINASNERFWERPIKRYVEECLAGRTGVRGRDFNMRWVASLVAEAFRVLMRGGVFLYPLDENTREQGGRLGLLHEANPIAFLIEQAGGAVSTGRQRLLDVQPEKLHQLVPVIFGSSAEVARIVRYHDEYRECREPDVFNAPLFSSRSLFR